MPGDVTVAVEFSTVNYKDALAITERAPTVRRWPMMPGIDFAGTVARSWHPDYRPGERVMLNGGEIGRSAVRAREGSGGELTVAAVCATKYNKTSEDTETD